MSEIKDIHSMPAAIEHSAGKVEKDKNRIIKEKDIHKTEDNTVQLEEKNKDGREDANVKMLRSAIDTINESLKETHKSVRMKYHEKLHRVSIKIVDDETEEVIKEIPPEENLEMVQKMLEQAGIIVDERG